MKVNNFRLTKIVIDSLSTSTNITNVVTISENDSAVVEREVGLERKKDLFDN
jgi:hypothetical protein